MKKSLLEQILTEDKITDQDELKYELANARKMISDVMNVIDVFFTQLNHLNQNCDKKDRDLLSKLATALDKKDTATIKSTIGALGRREHQWKTALEAFRRMWQTNATEKMLTIMSWAKSGSGKDITDTI